MFYQYKDIYLQNKDGKHLSIIGFFAAIQKSIYKFQVASIIIVVLEVSNDQNKLNQNVIVDSKFQYFWSLLLFR